MQRNNRRVFLLIGRLLCIIFITLQNKKTNNAGKIIDF